eukprot:s2019_g12.t2
MVCDTNPVQLFVGQLGFRYSGYEHYADQDRGDTAGSSLRVDIASEKMADLTLDINEVQVAEILLDQGWSVSRLAVLHDDVDGALPILMEQMRGADAVVELSEEDIMRLLGSCNLFAGLSWQAEASKIGCLAEAFVRNVRARTQEKSDVLAKLAHRKTLPFKGAAPVVRWPTRRARLKAEAGDSPLLRQKAEDEERDRWINFLAVRGAGLWGAMAVAPYQFIDYLEERASEPYRRSVPLSLLKTLMFMEASAELPEEQQLCSHPAVANDANAMQEVTRFLESATPLTTCKANMLPVQLVVMLERAMVHTGGSRFAKALAWYKLVKVWGLEATLLRTKTSGPGKPVKSLQFYVSKDCWIDEPYWLQIGWELWEALGKEAGLADRDFLLPVPGSSLESLTRKVTSYADASTLAKALLSNLPSDETGDELLRPGLAAFLTEHSERASLRFALPRTGRHDLLGYNCGRKVMQKTLDSYRRHVQDFETWVRSKGMRVNLNNLDKGVVRYMTQLALEDSVLWAADLKLACHIPLSGVCSMNHVLSRVHEFV